MPSVTPGMYLRKVGMRARSRFRGLPMSGAMPQSGRRLSKRLPERLREIEEAHPEAEKKGELWAEDEARLGLKPVM